MARCETARYGRYAAHVFTFSMFFIAGLAISRLLYEAAFPYLLRLARPIFVLPLAFLTGIAGWFCWHWLNQRSKSVNKVAQGSVVAWTFLPFLINLAFLFDPIVDLTNSRLLFAASVWLTALVVSRSIFGERNWPWLGSLFILTALLPLYLTTIPQAVGQADTFEFQVVIPQMGIAHPTGYPLYLLLGRLFAFIPAGTVAWRVNLASIVFALMAIALLYSTARRLLQRPLAAILAVVALGLTPVYWSQAIEAEVYALHALIGAAVLLLMTMMLLGDEDKAACPEVCTWPIRLSWQRAIMVLALLIGLGLTNHLTSLFLLPPAVLTVLLAYGSCLRGRSISANVSLLLKTLAAFLLPLLLYAYLPLRWQVLHGEPMGISRFLQWIIGGRFQGALQLSAWLSDMTRYEVVGRLVLQNWGWLNLIVVLTGLLFLLRYNWRVSLVLIVTWLGYVFYALNYYVPDLAVFLIPADVVMTLFWGAGLAALLAASTWLTSRLQRPALQLPLSLTIVVLLLLPSINRLGELWSDMESKDNNQLLAWGKGVLEMPIQEGAAILADSEKIAPLYYLQQAEGMRPDLNIMVLANEAAYRAELESRLQTGQTVYLARFLPGLEGIYHLRSLGPLVEVSQEPLLALPEEIMRESFRIGDLQLVGVAVQERSAFDPSASAVTLHWKSVSALADPQYIYLRWAGEDFVSQPFVSTGQHPVNNTYPTTAWQEAEIVPDFHLLPLPTVEQVETLELQVAAGPAFQSADDLDWQSIMLFRSTSVDNYEAETLLRAQNGRTLLSGVDFPAELRPQTPLTIILTGYGNAVQELQLALRPSGESPARESELNLPPLNPTAPEPFTYTTQLDTDLPLGSYDIVSRDPQLASICGWLARKTSGCILGEVAISGVALPPGSTNYEDKIALLDVGYPQSQLQPGGQFTLNLRWQSLSSMNEDYTIFIQVLDAQDRIVGQVDAWPLQGTYPTTQWEVGEIIEDPYRVQLDADLPPGSYKLHIGWYLLSTLRRLSVLNKDGQATDDKLVIDGLYVP